MNKEEIKKEDEEDLSFQEDVINYYKGKKNIQKCDKLLFDTAMNNYKKGLEQGRKDKEDEIRKKIEEYFEENKENMASYGGLDILIINRSKLQELLKSIEDKNNE